MVRGNVNQQRVKNFVERIPWQAKDLLKEPGIPPQQILVLRASLMLEECMETIQKGLGLDIMLSGSPLPIEFENILFRVAREPNLVEIADGLADQEVVNLGTAESCGIDLQPIFDCVMDNNDMKIATGSFSVLGKLVKHPDHPAPDIRSELKDQGWEEK